MIPKKPMLAAKLTKDDLDKLPWPLLGSPKLDGVRALVQHGQLMSRSLKPIPNVKVTRLYSRSLCEGFDGELIVGSPTAKTVLNTTSSLVDTIDGKADGLSYYVFDLLDGQRTYEHRYELLYKRIVTEHRLKGLGLRLVPQTLIKGPKQLLVFEEKQLAAGYEGVMLRSPQGLYKHGRSTIKQAFLMKLKRFIDAEAEIVGAEELQHNTNTAELNELGYMARSSKKAGLRPGAALGAFVARDLETGVVFKIGTGPMLTKRSRTALWQLYIEGQLVGRVVKYRYFPIGVKNKPRFPVALSFRGDYDR